MIFVQNDGGRDACGFKGETGDCVTRAIAIASGLSYRDVYDRINFVAKSERLTKKRRSKSSARTGVHKPTIDKLMKELGAVWFPLMGIGTGCKVHLSDKELPPQGRFVLSLSRHLAAWIDGQLHDTYDCSRDGTRCVYGYWVFAL